MRSSRISILVVAACMPNFPILVICITVVSFTSLISLVEVGWLLQPRKDLAVSFTFCHLYAYAGTYD